MEMEGWGATNNKSNYNYATTRTSGAQHTIGGTCRPLQLHTLALFLDIPLLNSHNHNKYNIA